MISILLATYNGEKYIKESIDSILSQTYTNFELLIGLNNTNDSTLSILKSYNDPRIKIFEFDEKGKGKTLNKLLSYSRFEWISIQDDDDIWDINKLDSQIIYINDYDIIGTYINYINSDGIIFKELELESNSNRLSSLIIDGHNQIANSSSLFKSSDIKSINGWREDIDGIEDMDIWVKFAKLGKRFYNIPKYLVNHRIHKSSNFNNNEYDKSTIL